MTPRNSWPSLHRAAGVWLSLVSVCLSGLALGLTVVRCSSDGSFDVFGPNVSRSSYCKALGLPAVPSGASSLVLASGLFLLPSAIIALSAVLSVRRGGSELLLKGTIIGALAISVSIFMIAFAHVQYLGAP